MFVYPEMSYFLVSMLVLLLALKLDRAGGGRLPAVWNVLLSVAVAFAVLIRSVGVAFLAALVAWVVVSFYFLPQKLALRRLLRFSVPLIVGVATQIGWTAWAQGHEFLEWKLPGYPQSYLSQLELKNAHEPELGQAELRDIPARVVGNVMMRAGGLTRLLARRYVAQFWSSPSIIGVFFLITLGLVASLRNGGEFYDWYFLFHEAIFALWPWGFSNRFLFLVGPLACLYAWRGGKALKDILLRWPKPAGLCLAVSGFVLALISAGFASGFITFNGDPQHARGNLLQPLAAVVFWLIVSAAGILFLRFKDSGEQPSGPQIPGLFRSLGKPRFVLLLRFASVALLASLVVVGTAHGLAVGRVNVAPDVTRFSGYPMIQAAGWIRSNEPTDRVVMARDADFIFHYVGRRVVWFPPISDPKALMAGIRKYKVGVILVMHHEDNYWLPAEDTCFQALLNAYGSAFRLVYEGSESRVYEVLPDSIGS